ncbi:MAG: hypothetical protein ACOYEC_02330 [Christensenellales bacterium]|jgi:hypothetical protein|nr:hypothetical protein [Clostridiales bacterium]
MTVQEFSDKVSEAVFMNIEEVLKIEEDRLKDGYKFLVKLETGESFVVMVIK